MQSKMRKFLEQYVVLIILMIFSLFAAISSDKFLTVTNITNIVRQVSMNLIIGCAVTPLMISGGIDLSVGSIMGLTAVTLARLVGDNSGFPYPLAIVIVLMVGLACGALNGLLVVKLNILPFIATLATMYVFRGAAKIVCDNLILGTGFPENYTAIGQGYLFGIIPIPVIIAAVVFAVFLMMQEKTKYGRYIYAIGGNESVSRLAGVSVAKVKFASYCMIGLVTAISGIILTSRVNSGGPDYGEGTEFDVILAVLLGGVSMSGGKGSIKGMLFATLVIQVLNNGLNLRGVPEMYRQIISGTVFILAILLYKLIRREKILGD